MRTLLVWLLVLAVPAQGAAAVTMAFCGPDHHGVGTTTPPPHAAGAAAHAHHEGAGATDHKHPQAFAQQDENPSGANGSVVSAEVSDTSQHTCSACAACCSVAAILSSVLVISAPAFTPTVFSTVVPGVDTFAAGGPDRPPRTVPV